MTTAVVRNLATGALLLWATAFMPSRLRAESHVVSYQGYLTDANGQAINGPTALGFRLYDHSVGGNVLWSESYPAVEVSKGVFTVFLGSTSPLNAGLFDADSVWLETSLAGSPLAPRRQVASVPMALRATVADSVVGGSGSGFAQWEHSTLDTSAIAYKKGFVGIGTDDTRAPLTIWSESTSPTRKLLFISDIDNPQTHGGDDLIFFGDNTGVTLHQTFRKLSLGAGGGVTPSKTLTVSTNGNVGVGTIDPVQRLEVNGSALIDQDMIVSGYVGLSDQGLHFRDGTVQTTAAQAQGESAGWRVTDGNIVTTTSGNVGIGTDLPTSRLQVVGEVSADSVDVGRAHIGGDSHVDGDSYVEGDAFMSGSAHAYDIQSEFDVQADFDVSAGGEVIAQGGITDNGYLDVVGDVSTLATITADGDVFANSALSVGDSLVLWGDLKATGDLYTDGEVLAQGSLRTNGDVVSAGQMTMNVHDANGHDVTIGYVTAEVNGPNITLVGRASLTNGTCTIALPPEFTSAVDPGSPGYVFVTPRSSQSKGLYVYSLSTSTSVQIRELQNGTGNYAFDYQVVARRADALLQSSRQATTTKVATDRRKLRLPHHEHKVRPSMQQH